MYAEEALMFDIGIFAPFGTNHDRNIAYCRDAGATPHRLEHRPNLFRRRGPRPTHSRH